MNQLQSYMNNGDVAGMGTILQALDTWSQYQYVQNGQQLTLNTTIPDPANPGSTLKLSDLGTMDRYMAQDVDTLMREFRAAGYDPVNSNPSTSLPTYVYTKPGIGLSDVAAELFGTNASLYNVAGSITQAITDAQQARITTNVWSQSQSIQQLLMVDYISTGNTLLFGQMSQLKSAIDLNQSALTYLNSLQDLMNQKDPQSFVLALQDLSGSIGASSSTYSQFEQDSFNQQLQNVAKFSDSDVSSYLKNILGLTPTATPSAATTAGTALGAFQALSPTYLASTLNQYLTNQGLTTNIASLMPALSDNANFATPLSTFATANSLSASDQELIWQTFLVKEAGTNLPSSLCTTDQNGNLTDVVDPSHLSHFNTFLGALGSATSATLPTILQTNIDQIPALASAYTDFDNALVSDAGVTNVGGLAALYPPEITLLPASQITSEINSNFTAYTLTSDEILNILRAFLVKQGAVQGIASTAVDMTQQANLDALGAYAKSISDLLPIYQAKLFALTLDASGLSDAYPAQFDWTAWSNAVTSGWTTPGPAPFVLDSTTQLTLTKYVLSVLSMNWGVLPQQIDINSPGTLTNFVQPMIQSIAATCRAQHITTEAGLEQQLGIAGQLSSMYPPNMNSLTWYQNQIESSFAGASFTLSAADERRIMQAFVSWYSLTPTSNFNDPSIQSNFITYLNYFSRTSYPQFVYQCTLYSNFFFNLYPPDLSSVPATIQTILTDNFTAFPITDAEKLQIVQAAVTNFAETSHPPLTPQQVNLSDPNVIEALGQYIASLSTQLDFVQIQTVADAGTPNLASLQPPTLAGWDNISSIINTSFANTNITLSPTDKVNILRAFLVVQANALSTQAQPITPDQVDMANPTNIAAFQAYVANLADKAAIMPVSWLTSVPDISINPYGALLSTQFSTANGYTADDQLNIWKAFLITQGLTTDANVPLGVSATSADFSNFVTAITPYVQSTTGTTLVNGLYAYLLQQKGLPTLNSDFQTIAELTAAGTGWPTGSNAAAVISTFQNTIKARVPSATQFTSADWVNVWRSYLIYTKEPNSWYNDTHLVNSGSWVASFAQDLQAQIGTTTGTGSSLVNLLNAFALYPHQSGANSQLTTTLDAYVPSSSYSDADRLNFWQGFMTFNGNTQPGYYSTSVMNSTDFTTAMTNYLTSLGETVSSGQLSTPLPTGQALVNLINSGLYQQQSTANPTTAPLLTSLTSVTAAPAPTTISQYMDSVLGTTTLTDDQKVQIWNAFLASNANGKSIMRTGMLSAGSIGKFKTFLTSMSKSDMGESIETRIARIISNLQLLSDEISQIASGSSLQSQINVVLNDFSNIKKNGQSITTWVQDYVSGQVGNYQNDLNNAIVASQGLNDTQREELQNVMFVYEEFYKSATSMLSNLNDLIVKMADAMSRG
jgi:hypothetical protein